MKKTTLAARILCFALAAIMVAGAAYSLIAILL